MDKNGRVRLFYQIMKEAFGKKTVTLLIANLESIGFFDAPASTKYHGSYPGGLFDHSFAVTKTLLSLTERLELKWKRPQSPYLIGMLHDLCKCDNYIRKPDDTYEYNTGLTLTGHGDKSLWLSRFFTLRMKKFSVSGGTWEPMTAKRTGTLMGRRLSSTLTYSIRIPLIW